NMRASAPTVARANLRHLSARLRDADRCRTAGSDMTCRAAWVTVGTIRSTGKKGGNPMHTRRSVLAGAAAALAAPAIVRAQGAAPIRIGEINSYSAIPSFTLPYRNGWQLAVEEVNAAGGVLGRK